jgi:hypothetical protein
MTKLEVWHYPQIPCQPFRIPVNYVSEAVKIMDVLADYDLFQYANQLKSDYSNATLLVLWDEKEQDWLSWEIEVDGEWFDDPYKYVEHIKQNIDKGEPK